MTCIKDFLYKIEAGDTLAKESEFSVKLEIFVAEKPHSGKLNVSLVRDRDYRVITKKEIVNQSKQWSKVIVFHRGSLGTEDFAKANNIEYNELCAVDERHPDFENITKNLKWSVWWLYDKHGALKEEFPEMEGIL